MARTDDHAGGDGAGGAGESLRLGLLGELHPLVAGEWGLGRTAVFAIDLGGWPRPLRRCRASGPSAPTRRCARTSPWSSPSRCRWPSCWSAYARRAADSLEQVRLFDVYTGEQVGEGRRSLALALAFRSPERTLTDEDVAPVRERIVAAIEALGGELRG